MFFSCYSYNRRKDRDFQRINCLSECITFVSEMDQKIQDKELGVIVLRSSTRAKNYTLKISNGQITAIMPLGGNVDKMLSFIEEKRPQLIKALLKRPAKGILDESTELQTSTFKLHIFRTDRANYYMKLEAGILHIACPRETDFSKESVQRVLKDLLGRALTHEANKILPRKLHELAVFYGFVYSGVKITKTKSCWGSCSSSRIICLSRSLMLLPEHLIDYILLHELCHTLEMSHNARFWELMDNVTNNDAKNLRRQLKQYHTI